MRDIKTFLANLSHYPGVYQMLGENDEVLYVGKAKDLKKRISSYFSSKAKDPKTLSLMKYIKDINITVTHNENEAVLLECNLIKKHRPRYNVLLRDDKSYPYILITIAHPYPRPLRFRVGYKSKPEAFGSAKWGIEIPLVSCKKYFVYLLVAIPTLKPAFVPVCFIK